MLNLNLKSILRGDHSSTNKQIYSSWYSNGVTILWNIWHARNDLVLNGEASLSIAGCISQTNLHDLVLCPLCKSCFCWKQIRFKLHITIKNILRIFCSDKSWKLMIANFIIDFSLKKITLQPHKYF
ncbi:hypothetical protein O6H91_04G039400 [Diphasiastrum complanatum]|uniref:Uncharacterized protein n=1 Tax=Diphasiastrum complanatum TaxID=34168 RepID=A0ACC2DWC7_DIPCM|nr:hypothetical protein O6H91_04G039400 [Diphasiastrum complanatum]